jgi:hypothetical protein
VHRAYERLPQALQDLICEWLVRRRGGAWADLSQAEQARVRGLTYWPLVEGSDPARYDEVGRRSTWLKMAAPSLEGIRLALLDPESRLRPGSDPAPGADYPYVSRIKVSDTDFFEEIEVDLNPCLNALIGGRGTGKSMLIECLRWGLDRARPSDLGDGPVRDSVERLLASKDVRDFGQTPGVLLPGSLVETDVVVSGGSYQISRNQSEIRIRDPEDWYGEGLEVRALIAPRILSQGQVAEIANDPAAQRRELDAIVGDPIREFEENTSSVLQRMEALQVEIRGLADLERTVPAMETELRTLIAKIEFLEQGENQALMQRMAAFRREQQWLRDAYGILETRATALEGDAEAATAASERVAAVPDGPSKAWLETVADRVRAELSTTAEGHRARASALRETRQILATEEIEKWTPPYRETSEAFSRLETALREREVQFSQHRQLVERRVALESRLAPLRDIAVRLERARRNLSSEWSRLYELHVSRSERRRAAAAEFDREDQDIRIRVLAFADRDDLDSRRDQWFGGTGVQERDWQVLVDYVFSDNNGIAERWRSLINAIRQDGEHTSRVGRTVSGRPSRIATAIGERAQQLTRHFYNALLHADRMHLNEAERFLPNDLISSDVRDASGEFKPIAQGSLGQRATAVLSLVLGSGENPLVIDQPEEDLDNSYVYRVVVELLRRRKFTRQIIVATHNPNIPVNGDAEQIVVMDVEHRAGRVDCAGSIDLPDIKERVSNILEGSAEAFKLRSSRYGF